MNSLPKTTSYYICIFIFVFSTRNIQILKQQLSGLWEQENHLTLVPGYTGNIAKVIYNIAKLKNLRLNSIFKIKEI